MQTMTTPAPATQSPAGTGERDRLRWRLALIRTAFAHVLLGIPALALFVVTTVAIPLTIITVGVVLLMAAVPAAHALASAHRALASSVLGERVESPYRPVEGEGVLARLRTWARDGACWREYVWLLFSCTVGWALAFFTVALPLAVGWYLVFPLVWAVTPEGTFDMNYGLFTIDTFGETLLHWGVAAVAAALTWRLTPPLVRARARVDASLLGARQVEQLQRRVQTLTETRAETVDSSAAELRRIERDLHDGAQARLVALGMSLGMAQDMLDRDPEQARELLAEARGTTTAALSDLRTVVRGIHPPVLADRGLAGAVQAIALDIPMPITVTVTMAGRPPAPVESAAYFAVIEALANVVKHARARRAWVSIEHDAGVLRIEVGDDGVGGADLADGTGLAGVERRLSAFDGTMGLSSPTGGPTTLTMELPCVLSSPKTSPSSGTD